MREWFANLIVQIVAGVIAGIVLAVILSFPKSEGETSLPTWLIIVPAFVIAAFIFLMLFRYVAQKPHDGATSNKVAPVGGGEKPDFQGLFNLVEPELRKLQDELGKLGGGEVVRKERFKPDVVLGVLSEELVGGCIIGAWLASPSFLQTKNFYPIYYNNNKKKNKAELLKGFKEGIKKQNWRNFLLVDDDSQSGNTIATVHDELKKSLPKGAKVKIAVIVIRHESWSQYYNKLWGNNAVYCYSDVPMPKEHDVRWPWEA